MAEIGILVPPEAFTSFIDVRHDFLVMTTESGNPHLIHQPKDTSTHVKIGKADAANTYGLQLENYVIEENGNYRVIYRTNVSTSTGACIVYYDQSFKDWLDANNSHMFSGQSIALPNGTFTDVLVGRLPEADKDAHAQHILWHSIADYDPATNAWAPVDPATYASEFNAPSQYDTRLFSDISWYTPEVQEQIRVATGGNITMEMPSVTLEKGLSYDSSHFESFGPVNHDVVVLGMDGAGAPMVEKVMVGTSGSVQLASVVNGDPSTVYILAEGSMYRLLDFEIDMMPGQVLVYYTEEFKQWLDANVSFLHEDPVEGSMFVVRSKHADSSQHIVHLMDGDSSEIDVTNLSMYLDSIANYDTRFYSGSPNWLNPSLKEAVDLAMCELENVDPLTVTDPVVVDDSHQLNLIYTKSLYEKSEGYINDACLRLQQELTEEQNVQQYLNSEDSNVTQDLNDFIATKEAEISTKLQEVNDMKDDLANVIQSNQQSIQDNQELHTLLNSPPAVDVSNKILELKCKINESLQLLIDNNRLGSNYDTIYLINRTSL